MEDRRSYIYRHVRKDTNKVFYVGKGSTSVSSLNSNSIKKKYKRAFSRSNRNNWWLNISNLGYVVEIISCNLTQEEANELESFVIQEYGRKDCNIGCLVNLTDGGEGTLGYKMSQSQKDKIGDRNRGDNNFWRNAPKESHPMYGRTSYLNPYYGKTHNEEIRAKMKKPHLKNRGENHPKSKVILNTQTGIFYVSIKEASESCEVKYNTLKNMLNGSHKINDTYFIKV